MREGVDHVADENEKVEQEAKASGAGSKADVDRQDQTQDEQGAPSEQAPMLSPLMQDVVDGLKAHLPGLKPTARDDEWVEINVEADALKEVALTLRDRLGFDYLSMISAVDYRDEGFEVVYHLLSLLANKKLVIKVRLADRENPTAPSVVDVWPTADFHEREAWDLMGVRFEGHPDLRRILMREDWEGHPLRKDYVDDRAPRERQTRETYYESYIAKGRSK